MSNSVRGPQRGNGGPFVMHLERVCRLIELGARFAAVEFNPNSDADGRMIGNVGLRITDGGGVSLVMIDGSSVGAFGMTLANYKKLWRCWQNGTPTEAQRGAMRWG